MKLYTLCLSLCLFSTPLFNQADAQERYRFYVYEDPARPLALEFILSSRQRNSDGKLIITVQDQKYVAQLTLDGRRVQQLPVKFQHQRVRGNFFSERFNMALIPFESYQHETCFTVEISAANAKILQKELQTLSGCLTRYGPLQPDDKLRWGKPYRVFHESRDMSLSSPFDIYTQDTTTYPIFFTAELHADPTHEAIIRVIHTPYLYRPSLPVKSLSVALYDFGDPDSPYFDSDANPIVDSIFWQSLDALRVAYIEKMKEQHQRFFFAAPFTYFFLEITPEPYRHEPVEEPPASALTLSYGELAGCSRQTFIVQEHPFVQGSGEGKIITAAASATKIDFMYKSKSARVVVDIDHPAAMDEALSQISVQGSIDLVSAAATGTLTYAGYAADWYSLSYRLHY